MSKGWQAGQSVSTCSPLYHILLMPFFLSMIRPTLEYCAGVWGCCGELNSETLETLQKCVGRIVIKTPSSDTAMKALKWPSLRSRRDEHILKLVRKCIHGWCPQYFKNYFVFNKGICARSTRQIITDNRRSCYSFIYIWQCVISRGLD